ncbi:MAG TPA: hypothetical protein VK053_25125, partial [Jiangellaceae bacterium]|nr:hypothetical protein [Jiangellaceae bacterium]
RPSSGTAASITEGPSQLGGSGTALVRHAASAAVVDQHFSDVEAELDRVPTRKAIIVEPASPQTEGGDERIHDVVGRPLQRDYVRHSI